MSISAFKLINEFEKQIISVKILVTNYKEGIRSEPIENVLPGKRIIFDEKRMEITINESLIIGVFDGIPQIRNIPANRSWFESNIYHLAKT